MIFSGGMELIKAGVSYTSAMQKAKSDRQWQAYNNAMVNISAGLQQNAISTNEAMARESSIRQGVAIRRSEFLTEANAEASAAASGTTGRSVNAVLFDVQRNAAEADANRINDWENQEVGFQYQRQQTAQAAMNAQDMRTIPNPSLATTMLGLGAGAGKIAKDNPAQMDQIKSFFSNML